MDRFGMDLGTTNSAVCYYNPERKAFEFLKIGSQTLDFFPTMIAYKKSDDSVRYIGEMAKQYQFMPDFDVYSLFKLSMGDKAHEKQGRARSPYQVTRDFIDEVIKAFVAQCGQKELNNLVLTVPDVWKNEERNKIAVDHIMQIFDELGWDTEDRVALESEPVSAVAYYCAEVCETPYNGYCVVIDYGGGTLDLTLCKVTDGKNITVLRRCGDGGASGKGCAGAAFDTALTRRIVEKYHLDPVQYAEGTPQFGALRNYVEAAKISATQETKKGLRIYYQGYDEYSGMSFGEDCSAFLVPSLMPWEPGYQVMASDVAEVFAQVNAEALQQALDTMQDYCKELDIDTGSQEHFRVLMVGGFSNLYCVESMCRKAFGSLDGVADRRFDEKMRHGGRCSTAIAHGAGIIASGMAKIDYNCQSNIGFYYYDICKGMVPVTMIHKDTPVRSYKEPQYPQRIYLRVDALAKNASIRLFFDDGSGIVPVTMDSTFRELFPNVDKSGNTYQIGFSMGRHQIPMIHVKDSSGQVNSQSLHQIISQIALRMVPEGTQQQEE